MGSIKILSQVLINQIAAGEVIERPASVVKELIENSMDAGATRLIIEIEQAGLALIKVSDNGKGMNADDARLAFHRYATSKIDTLEDLSDIHSFGFRGEALAALASVSTVELATKEKDALSGWKVCYREGKEISHEEIGCPEGTSIEVKNLFSFVPARKKFMKTASTEWQHIFRTVTECALARPDVSFTLLHDGKMACDLPKTTDWFARIRDLLGKDFAGEMIPVSWEAEGMKLDGFIGKPAVSQSSKKHQYLFVNGRAVNDQLIARACFDAYQSLLFSRTYPIYVLRFSLPGNAVDVNVHPRKREVKFLKSNDVFSFISKACRTSLEQHVLYPKIQFDAPTFSSPQKFSSSPFPFQSPDSTMPTKREDGLSMPSLQGSSIRPVSQIADSYIIAHGEEGLWIIDQHAAHERVQYELLKRVAASKEKMSQPLLTPISFEFSRQELGLLTIHQNFLHSLGFAFESFGGNTFLLTAVPADFAGKDMKQIFLRIFDELSKDDETSLPPGEKILRQLACKSAVKFGQSLTLPEQESLLKQLFCLEQKSTCPHGRPVMMELTFSELERRFRRS